MNQPRTVLVVGTGSIGRRHARNLVALGVPPPLLWDPVAEQAAAVAAELGGRAVATLEQGLAERPSAVIVCSPPSFHVAQARAALLADSHVFVEKPVSDSLVDLDLLERLAAERRRVVQVGYNLRFVPALRRIKALIDEGAIGRVLWMRAEFGQYLPDWRPGRDYRQGYNASRALGGGIILDASHEIDYVLWFLGRAVEMRSLAARVSDLELEVEDCATLLVRFASGAQADIHVDCLQRTYSRGCKLVGETGTIEWSFGGPLRTFQVATGAWQETEVATDVPQAYVEELRHFFACCDSAATPESNLQTARAALELALSARPALAPATAGGAA